MARPRFRSSYLKEKYYHAPEQRMLDTSTLNGGLNLWELDYKLRPNQSPNLMNMYWKDGALCSRGGQEYVFNQKEKDEHGVLIPGQTQYGNFYGCYEREWVSGFVIAHKGTKLYKINISTGAHTEIYSGLTQQSGNFFVFGDKLYYMNGAEYIQITQACVASAVVPYIPIVVLGRKPDGTGGTKYQPENRLGAGMEVHFTADGTSTKYVLPYKDLDLTPAMTAKVNGTDMTEGSGFSVNRTTGEVTFDTAPTQGTVITPNNVQIKCYKTDNTAKQSILSCRCVIVYGGDTNLAVVVGGPTAQPNAYFWSGHNSTALDPSYFPFDYYNFAGTADEFITGFGKQQSMLVIFKERSIGKSYFSVETIEDRDYLKLPYTAINGSIGCDRQKTIKLVQNNLVFANTYGGVFALTDTTAAGENTVVRLSRNVNGDGETNGLLYKLRTVSASAVTSFDDGERYWLVAGGEVYLWDYTLLSYRGKEENLSWFRFDNINAYGWFKTIGAASGDTSDVFYYFTEDGSFVELIDDFTDFGEGFMRRYVFATLNFGTYEALKDVLKVIFAVRSDTNSRMELTYDTDFEHRKDLTDIASSTWKLTDLGERDHRALRVDRYAGVNVRKPRCFHIRHFSMTLENNIPRTDMSLIGAQIIYRITREDR